MIYLTPNFAFAMHCASAPEGNNEVNHNEKTVRFENLGKFNPEEKGYIYVVDPSRIPEGKMKFIDPWQVAVDLDEITPDKVETHKAGELLQHYSII